MGVGGWKGGYDWIKECLMVGVELQMHWGDGVKQMCVIL